MACPGKVQANFLTKVAPGGGRVGKGGGGGRGGEGRGGEGRVEKGALMEEPGSVALAALGPHRPT